MLIATICIATLIIPHASVVLAEALTNEKDNNVNKVNLMSLKFHEGGPESSESLSEDGEDKYDRRQYQYIFGGDGKTDILKIVREDDKSSAGAYLYSDAFYCLDGNNSFPTINDQGVIGSIEYTRTIEDFFAGKPTTFNMSDEHYNALCWLLDNLYLRKQMNSAAQRQVLKDALLNRAFDNVIHSGYEDAATLDDIKAEITDDDIEVIQQWAIWYFTNNGENTIQGVPFVQTNADGSLKLPTIDKKEAISQVTDSVNTEKHEWLTVLYQYLVNEALKHKNEEFKPAGSATYPTISSRDITCEREGDFYKVGPFRVTAPSGGLSSSDYQITLTDGNSEISTSKYTIKDEDGNTISKKVNEIFDTNYYIYLQAEGNTIENLKLNLSYSKFGTKASVWAASNPTYQPLVLLTKEGDTITDNVAVKIEGEEPKADLALRKYIIAVNDKEITDRVPTVDVRGLANGDVTTAEYRHKKQPIEVKVGDTVTYRMTVFNEGDLEGKALEVADYLPNGLEVVADNETNSKYDWQVSEKKDGDKVIGTVATTTFTKDNAIPAFNKENGNISTVSVDIVCKITDDIVAGQILTNIAEIVEDDIEDRDSTPRNFATDSILSDYIGTSGEKDLSKSDFYYKGYEDDDDFEKVMIAGKAFDLSLQKFITKVNGKAVEPKREPVVDTTPLKNGQTTAKYTTVKTPVLVKAGDIVTYTIRVYNEGEVDGYAEKVTDYLPDGLGFLVNYNENIDNAWAINKGTSGDLKTIKLTDITDGTKNLKKEDFTGITDLKNVDVVVGDDWKKTTSTNEDACMSITTTALSSTNTKNLINSYDGSDKLSYKDVQVTCIVLGNSLNLKNVAEVTEDLDADKNEVNDRDSTPNNDMPWNGKDSNEDDNDYEILTMEENKFDLALQKFITAVNSKEITDRVPKVNYQDGKITYSHPQTALEVNNGDKVTYTIRVYNEGGVDGYAAEIGDDIPNGLVFDSKDETNKKYGWKMYDNNGNETSDSSKAVEIRTDYLSKQKSEARKEDALLKALDTKTGNLYYLDVKAVFSVNAKSSNDTITNTAEITKDTDKDGNEIDDIDSTPDNKKDGEDDIDKERVHVGYFDLALKKDLAKAVVTVGDSTTEYPAKDGQLLKVEINRKKINSTIVKFVYNITITNEGTIPGYATEIKDYIPEGLQFVEGDNKDWAAISNNIVVTDALAKKLLQPGESATVPVTLRWINGEDNLGLKTNVAEISQDYNDANDTDDIDSTPDNKKDGEDDIDKADVILSISTGSAPKYVILPTVVLSIIGTGVVMIKKFVL